MISSTLNGLKRLIKSGPEKPSGFRPPDGLRFYAFGDVHGRADLLRILLDGIAADIAATEKTWQTCAVVGLGDYIDRGPESERVIDLLMHPPLPPECPLTALRGNHEDVFLNVLTDATALADWLDFGGDATLVSYGVGLIPGAPTPDRIARMHAELVSKFPTDHLDFLRAMPVSLSLGDFFLVHAGVRPGRSLEEQTPADLLWIRDPFLSSRRFHGAMIVHGHQITRQPDILENRIGIDTGAYCTGTLSCLAVDGDRRWLLQATSDGIRKTALQSK